MEQSQQSFARYRPLLTGTLCIPRGLDLKCGVKHLLLLGIHEQTKAGDHHLKAALFDQQNLVFMPQFGETRQFCGEFDDFCDLWQHGDHEMLP